MSRSMRIFGIHFCAADLYSPRALRIEISIAVAIVLVLGRVVPQLGDLLRQFSDFLLR